MIELGFLMVDWRQIFRVSLAVLAFAGATSSHAQAHGDGFSFEATARVKHVDWMKSVPGSVRLSAMSIPGTEQSLHDGPEKNGVRHQSMTLQNQLEAGIRAVDFRTVMVNGRLAVYNGQATHSLDDALDTLRNYLAAYPSEMIFVRLAAQPDDLIFVHAGPRLKRALPPASAEHARVFAQYLQNTRWSEYFWSIGTRDPIIPTLDAVRGKIVFILGSGYQSLPTGYTEEKKDGSRMTAYRNEVVNSSVSFYEKWQHVQNSFIDVRSAWPDGQFFTTSLEGSGGLWAASITFTPGFVASGRPTEASNKAPSLMGFGPITNHPFPDFPIGECVGLDDCAISYEGINQLAVNDLRQVSPVSAGIVTAAFPGTGLIETLIGLNKPRLTGEQIRFSPRQGQFQCVTAPRPGAANVAMVETCDDGDPLQRWLMGKDGLIRTALDANRCLKSDIEALKQGATHLFTTFISIRLASCLEPASERWIRQANGEITVATSPDKCLVSSTGTGNTSRAAAIACTWVPAESRRWTVQSPAMPIVSGHDQCLQVDAQAVADGSHPFIATCAADAGAMAVQAWSMQPDFSVRTAAAKDLCLHAETAAIGLKSSMTLRRCDGGLRQKWALRPDGSFRPLANENLCVRMQWWPDAVSNDVALVACEAGDIKQRFSLSKADFQLVWNNTRCLDVPGSDTSGRKTLISYQCFPAAPNQHWKLRHDLSIRSALDDNKCLSLEGDKVAAKRRLTLARCAHNPRQQWDVANGTVRPVSDRTQCIEVIGSNPSNGAPVQLNDCTKVNPAQRWGLR